MLASKINIGTSLLLFKEISCCLDMSHRVLCRKSNSSMCFSKGAKALLHFCSVRLSGLDVNSSGTNKDSVIESGTSDSGSGLFKNINYSEIVGNDETLLKKFKVLLLEIDVMRQDGFPVPQKISDERWKELLGAATRSQRLKLLSFLFRTEKKKENDRLKKEERRKQTEARKELYNKEKEENSHIHYGFGGSTIFLRVYDTKIDSLMNSKLITAMQFGQNLVLDCSYDNHMTPKEASLCAKQMMILFAANRQHVDPFNLHFCKADPETKVMKKLNGLIPTLYDDDFPLNITRKSYLDIFPRDRLVYLTPHCREDLKTYNHDDVYIIGGMVDKVNNEQLSLGIAKKEGLRMARLPLDKHLLWHIGSKSLTLNQVLMILLEMKSSGNWEKAFQHVPRRKILTDANSYNKTFRGPSMYRQRLNQFRGKNL